MFPGYFRIRFLSCCSCCRSRFLIELYGGLPELTWAPLNLYSRIILMSLLIVVLVQSFEHLRLMLLVMAGSLGFIGFKFGLFRSAAEAFSSQKATPGLLATATAWRWQW